jgi:hypothetical protein
MRKKTNTNLVPIKYDVELRVTVPAVRRYGRALYVKVMEKNLTMSGTTGQGLWITYQLGWSVAVRIAHDNPQLKHAVDHVMRMGSKYIF